MSEIITSTRHSIMLCFVQGFHTREDSKSRNLKRSTGSIGPGAHSAPSTPVDTTIRYQQSPQENLSPVSGSQLTIQSVPNHQIPLKSPSHIDLDRCKDSQLLKPLSRSTPSMTGGGIQSPSTLRRSSTRSSPVSTSSARQKKFNRHFSQVTPNERVLNYYSCALVGDILLQGHLYITPNYFAFYSNVFGYITKLLIPISSVMKISKEKTARIIPNAIAIATDEDRHVFCSLLSRDSTFKLMKQVWDVALEGRQSVDTVSLPVQVKLLTPDSLLADDSEINVEEDDSSMSESGTDLTSLPPTVCTDTEGVPSITSRTTSNSLRLEHSVATPNFPIEKFEEIRSPWQGQLRSSTIVIILIGLLAALYVSAALMLVRIDKLHTAYLNHPLASPEIFTRDQFVHYLNTNLDQIVKVRQSLQILSQQFMLMNQENEIRHSRSKVKSKNSPS